MTKNDLYYDNYMPVIFRIFGIKNDIIKFGLILILGKYNYVNTFSNT